MISDRLPKRFAAKVAVAASGCWEWTGYKSELGYGQFNKKGNKTNGRKLMKAHRFAYECLVGPIPDGLELDHLCRNPSCVNPAHLEPVTHRENMRRGVLGARTHCLHGHPFDEENTYTHPSVRGRICRTCAHNRRVAATPPERRRGPRRSPARKGLQS